MIHLPIPLAEFPVTSTTAIFVFIAIFVFFLAMRGLKIIQQSETMIIERLGKYSRTLPTGINIIWPVIDRPREIYWRYVKEEYGRQVVTMKSDSTIDLRETVFDFPRQNVITKDNVLTEINAILYFQITDPVKAIYEIANLPEAIEKLTQTTLRNVVGSMDLDETLTSRDTINTKLRGVLDEASQKWGVKVNRVELQDINPPEGIRDAMEKQMRAERDKRAQILEAEGTKAQLTLEAEGRKQAQILQAESTKAQLTLEAEGRKQAQILQAEGAAQAVVLKANAESEAINCVAAAVAQTGSNPAQYILATKYIEGLKEMVSGKDNKTVYLPYEATSVLGSLGGIKDLFNK